MVVIEKATLFPEPEHTDEHDEGWHEYVIRCRAEGSRATRAQLFGIYLWSLGRTVGPLN